MKTRSYRLTRAGARALEDRGALPSWYRALLDLIQEGRAFGADSPKQVLSWLDELETLGFAEPAGDPGIDTGLLQPQAA